MKFIKLSNYQMLQPVLIRRSLNLFLRLCIIFVLLVGIYSCASIGPDFTVPESQIEEQWIESDHPSISQSVTSSENWWEAFNDPVLNELVSSAYKQNLPLKIAGVRVFEARAQLGVALGNRLPQSQQFRGGATSVNISESRANTALLDFDYNSYNVGFDASWEIDFWGKFKRGIESADAQLLSEIANYDNFLVILISEVANAYVAIRTFEERLNLANQNVTIQERSLHITEVRFRNGGTTELDVQQAKSLLRNTQSLIPRLEAGLRRSTNALSVLLGLPPSDLRDVLGDQAGEIPTASTNLSVGIPSDLLRRRPDVKQAELRAASQSALIGVAKAELYPSFSLNGSLGFVSSSNTNSTRSRQSGFDELIDSDSIQFFGGPAFRWNIFNYGRIKNDVRVQDARFQQLVIDYQQTVLRAAQEVEDAMVGFLRTKEEAAFLQGSVDASARSVDLALLQYRDGVSDYTRVLDTQEFLVNQQDFLTSTKGEIARNVIAIYKALGGGWQLRGDDEFIQNDMKEMMRQRTDWGNILPE